jgi:hypothetical protein
MANKVNPGCGIPGTKMANKGNPAVAFRALNWRKGHKSQVTRSTRGFGFEINKLETTVNPERGIPGTKMANNVNPGCGVSGT